MKNSLIVITFSFSIISHSQDLNWNTVAYTTGSLTANFGSIGSPASTVTMNITGLTSGIGGGFPVKYIANPPGSSGDCSVNCALRTAATFTTTAQTLIYTFNFAPLVVGLTFNVYDIDGNGTAGAGGIRDRLTVTATNGVTAQNITMTDVDGITTVTGSGSATAIATASSTSSTDNRVNVSIPTGVTTLVITIGSDPSGSAGSKSYSIGNMDWTGVLPVTWISFTGLLKTTGSVDLKWQTENERNTSHYEIERSKDGQNFSAIAQVSAMGESRNLYSYTDQNPGTGNTFFRLRQVDFGGRYEFSNVILIKYNKNPRSETRVTPNPATQYILVNANNVQLSRLQIYDAAGRLMLQSRNGINRIDVSAFPRGIYFLKIETRSGEHFSESFIKN